MHDCIFDCDNCGKCQNGEVVYQLTSQAPQNKRRVCLNCGSLPIFQAHILYTDFPQLQA